MALWRSGQERAFLYRAAVISRVWATSPRLPSLQSAVSESNRSRSPQTTCASHYTSRPIVVSLSVDLLGVEPRSLDCKSKRRPVGKPLGISVTRVGFEPDLAGLKDQRPHQKSIEPLLAM